MTRDPVCGMEVDEREAEYKSQYQGRDYYFCREQCKQQFDANPERYVGRRPGGA